MGTAWSVPNILKWCSFFVDTVIPSETLQRNTDMHNYKLFPEAMNNFHRVFYGLGFLRKFNREPEAMEPNAKWRSGQWNTSRSFGIDSANWHWPTGSAHPRVLRLSFRAPQHRLLAVVLPQLLPQVVQVPQMTARLQVPPLASLQAELQLLALPDLEE
ncbi:hypothetical protein T265_10311 [Opisthorchis viverrini]|uniref:Uncharacterized protein n=1 Tax=Opisthorchis viverrini TaxID=6198 RepID=A0A074Z2W7_OPIVI|nr:hypothetical protein T265_10311 [Opisthorchis viverrini]KER21338.1 hypothetical protein T265_10311 [Opisthorchis viverrini]